MKKARHLVSQQKLRTVDKGVPSGSVDLDLTEIYPGIVCMGFPASGVEALYRNKYEDVLRYLDYKCGREYMVYNLCSESAYQYSCERFHGRVQCFPFPDHFAAPLRLMPLFVKSVMAYRAEHKGGTVAIHCKAGKGRTGVMACCVLLACEPAFLRSAEAVMKYYGEKRTRDGHGLTVPSQRRSVEYYARLLREYDGEVPADLPIIALAQIRLVCMPRKWSLHALKLFVDNGSEPLLTVRFQDAGKPPAITSDRTFTVTERGLEVGMHALLCEREPRLRHLCGDLRFEFVGAGNTMLGVLSVNTLFMEPKYSGSVIDRLAKEGDDESYIEFDYTVVSSAH